MSTRFRRVANDLLRARAPADGRIAEGTVGVNLVHKKSQLTERNNGIYLSNELVGSGCIHSAKIELAKSLYFHFETSNIIH